MTVARAAIAVALGCIVPLLLAASTARALNGGGQEPRTVLRYSACGGLINQQYSHISAFTLALALGAEVVLPCSWYRDSFGQHFSVRAEQNAMSWFSAPPESLLDVEGVVERWRQRGTTVWPPQASLVDCMQEQLRQPEAVAGSLSSFDGRPAVVAHLGDVYLSAQPLSALLEATQAAVRNATHHMQRPLGSAEGGIVLLDLPCTLFAVRTRSIPLLAAHVARDIPFNRHLHALALRAVKALVVRGLHPFNGVHLRVERDAGDWAAIMGGADVLWHLYANAMLDVRFNESTPLFVASGLLSYGAGEEWRQTVAQLLDRRVCSQVLHKELVIPPFELEGLNPEQLALLDFLILAEARLVAGFGSSTFSYYLREYRQLNGVPRSMTKLVAAPRIGTDELFAAAAGVTVDDGSEA